MFRSIFLFLNILLSLNILSQNDSLPINSIDDKGRKHGLWLVYADSGFKEVSKEKACFKYYLKYFHGKWVYGIQYIDLEKNWGINLIMDGRKPIKDSIVFLDGHYSVYCKNSSKKYMRERNYQFEFKEGHVVYTRKDYNNTGYNYEEFYFDKFRNGDPYSYYFQAQVNKNRMVKGFWYFKNGRRKGDITRGRIDSFDNILNSDQIYER